MLMITFTIPWWKLPLGLGVVALVLFWLSGRASLIEATPYSALASVMMIVALVIAVGHYL